MAHEEARQAFQGACGTSTDDNGIGQKNGGQKNVRGRASMAIIFLSPIFLSFWLRPKAVLVVSFVLILWTRNNEFGHKEHEGHKGKTVRCKISLC